jgi:methionine-rich copper-binding protein CopC
VNPHRRPFVDHPDVRALFVAAALLLAACAPPRTTSTADATATSPASAAATPSVPAATALTASPRIRPAFLSYQFTDVRDGATFRLTDFAGKSVLVIGMAVW